MKKLIKQVFRFGIVGGIAFLIDFGCLWFFHGVCGIPVLISNVLSFTISTVFNYIASVKWVFDVNQDHSQQRNFTIFIVFSVMGLGLNELIMWLCTDKMAIHYLVSKIVATAIVMVFNFVTRKIFLEIG